LTAGKGLVEQDELGLKHHHAPELQQLLLSAGQPPGRTSATLSSFEEKPERPRLEARISRSACSNARSPRDEIDQMFARLVRRRGVKVFAHRQMAEFPRHLERAHHAGALHDPPPLPFERASAKRCVPTTGSEARNDAEQRRLAGAVRAIRPGEPPSGSAQRDS